jgi:hypothetical protein
MKDATLKIEAMVRKNRKNITASAIPPGLQDGKKANIDKIGCRLHY